MSAQPDDRAASGLREKLKGPRDDASASPGASSRRKARRADARKNGFFSSIEARSNLSTHMRNAVSYKNLIKNLKSSWRGEVMSRHLRTRQLNNKAASYTNDSPDGFRDLHSHSAGKTTDDPAGDMSHKR